MPLGIPTTDGVVVSNFNTVAELGIPEGGMEVGVVSHEATHNLGEPDFYDTSYQSQGTGDWDNMAGGSHFGDPPGTNPLHPNPLVKLAQAWVEPQIITKTTKNIRLRPWEIYKDLVMVPLRYGDDPGDDPDRDRRHRRGSSDPLLEPFGTRPEELGKPDRRRRQAGHLRPAAPELRPDRVALGRFDREQ